MVRDDEVSAGLQRREHLLVHRVRGRSPYDEVVVGKIDRDEVEIADIRRHRIVVIARDAGDDFLFATADVEPFLGTVDRRREVLRVDGASGADERASNSAL